MGGRALKSVKTVRCDKPTYLKLSNNLLRELRRTFSRVELPRHYHTKDTFGDIDILVVSENLNMREYINSTFNPTEIFHNGNAWSFDYESIQIDLILVESDHFDSNFNYLGFSDISNFIGRIAQGFSLRYGQEGLWVSYYFKDTKHKIMVSKDYPKIYEFLGLDYRRWLKGFETLEEIFIFISESPYFNWRMFQLQELNRINRERNEKRASYTYFLEWMAENVADEDHEYQFDKDVSKYYSTINDFFPEANLLDEIAKIDYEVSRSKYAKTIFNGKVVMDVFGLKGAELGKAMKGFREYMELNGMEDLDTAYLTFGREVMIENFEVYLQVSGVVNEG
jgi:hypothetical protein